MRTFILLLLLIGFAFPEVQTKKLSFDVGKTKSGTPRLKIPNLKVDVSKDSLWTCFDRETVVGFVKNKHIVINYEQQIKELKSINELYRLNETNYLQIRELQDKNLKELKDLSKYQEKKYDELYDDLIDAESKKYMWAIGGFSLGLITATTILLLK